ncbi:MAG: RNA methyltransferase [Rickettsiales bacterium]
MTPTFVLVRPQMGENIGAAARGMANFGLSHMRLVAPRDGWPNVRAADMAGKALPILDDAQVFATTREAVADCQFVLATTSRERAMNLPVLDARAAMAEMHTRIARGEKVAVLFGPERTGLENEEIAVADAVVTVPVSPTYPSLNLGQAAVILGYEWFVQGSATGEPLPRERSEFSLGKIQGEGAGPHSSTPSPEIPPPTSPRRRGAGGGGISTSPAGEVKEATATRAQLHGLFDHLEAALDTTNFWRIPAKKEIMWRNIRASLTRAGMTSQEVATWRGIVKALRG